MLVEIEGGVLQKYDDFRREAEKRVSAALFSRDTDQCLITKVRKHTASEDRLTICKEMKRVIE